MIAILATVTWWQKRLACFCLDSARVTASSDFPTELKQVSVVGIADAAENAPEIFNHSH